MLHDLTLWTCLDMSSTLELPPSLFVTMGTRLERTQVTLCASNTQLIHRVSPSWEFHTAATSSQAPILLFCDSKPVSAHCVHAHPRSHTHRTPQTFSSFTAGCFLLRGLALAPGSRLFKVEPCNYKAISPVWCSCVSPFVMVVFFRHHLHQLSAAGDGKHNCSLFLHYILSSQ